MKPFLILLILLNTSLYSLDIIGKDSGGRSILLYNNSAVTESALLLIGGIHGDESETVQVVEYIRENLESELSVYYIPSINPTLYSIKEYSESGHIEIRGRRGYLREHLNKDGYVISGSSLKDYNKKLFYRIFYGNDKTYNNGIKHYVDPNRDFNKRILPSTRILISLINNLKERHNRLIIISFHGYMSGGRIYPEYSVINGEVKIDEFAWNLAKAFKENSGYIREKIYPPAEPIIERFNGELIRYTGDLPTVTALDIELDSNHKTDNKLKNLMGVRGVINYIIKGNK